MSEFGASGAFIVPPGYTVTADALRSGVATDEAIAAMRRHVDLAEQLVRCRYFTEEERSLHVTMDNGVTTSWEQTLPDAGATRDMLGLLRQLFGDKERSSFTSMVRLLRTLADSTTADGQRLLAIITAFENARNGALDSWDARPGGSETSPHPPLTVFLDWMYGEYLHSDAEKAARIAALDTEFRLYEWQFHWVAERLATVYTAFARIVEGVLATL